MRFQSRRARFMRWFSICALAVVAPLPALAASFNFSYTFVSGKVVEGMFDGNIAGDLITGITNVMASYDGTPFDTSAVFFDGLNTFDQASFSGTSMRFGFGSPSCFPDCLFLWDPPPGFGDPEAYVQIGGIVVDRDDPRVIASWAVSEKTTGVVPEPAGATLFSVGSLVVLAAVRRRKVHPRL